ncbi:hypothetical protein PY092_15030 [Muricauda sp. 334s03]|uniref:Uncharacterized protein n=1 Tax=Flagellimonas yonaguniensis TaxID=3031325 RepID=A0ABT5Y205_9FLAO|nr:hypothetical protein [[Muricauda] yonaguniensis]MDF0717476.1 hypothetical protein [[Muricauda] yonaguniensis]
MAKKVEEAWRITDMGPVYYQKEIHIPWKFALVVLVQQSKPRIQNPQEVFLGHVGFLQYGHKLYNGRSGLGHRHEQVHGVQPFSPEGKERETGTKCYFECSSISFSHKLIKKRGWPKF